MSETLGRPGSIESDSRRWLFAAALIFTLAGSWWLETISLSLLLSGGPDEGVYLGAARLLNHGYAFNSFYFDQFALFPQILALALRIGGDSVLAGRLTITLFSALGLLGVAVLARSMSARAAALLAILFTVSNNYYLATSRVVMAEVPGIALMLWALILASVYTQRRERVWLVASSVACTAGLLVKPLTLGLALPIGWWLIASRVVKEKEPCAHSAQEEPQKRVPGQKPRRAGHRVIDWRGLGLDLLFFAGAAILTAALFVNFSNLGGEFQRTVGFHLQETRVYGPNLSERFAGLVSFLAANRGWLGLGVLGAIAAAFKTPGRALPLLLAEAGTVLLLAQLSPFQHYYAILTPPLDVFSAIGAYEGFAALVIIFKWARGVVKYKVVSLTRTSQTPGGLRPPTWWQEILPGHSLFGSFLVSMAFLMALAIWVHDVPQLARYDYAVLRKTSHDTSATVLFLKQHTSPGDFLISDDPMVVFRADCLIPPTAINLSYASTFQLFAGSQQKLEMSVRDYNVKAIVGFGTFDANLKLMQWITSNYPIRRTVGKPGVGVISRTYWRELH
jgi:hypothetical protein